MQFLKRLFVKKTPSPALQEQVKEINDERTRRHQQVKFLFETALKKYSQNGCPCCFPRFRQISGIDCVNYRMAFSCYETELLISLSKTHFLIEPSTFQDENINEKWICKTCKSHYEFGWQDFSIAVERQKLKLVQLKATQTGKEALMPIPLYLGLSGHSFPSQSEITPVPFEMFEKYMMEE